MLIVLFNPNKLYSHVKGSAVCYLFHFIHQLNAIGNTVYYAVLGKRLRDKITFQAILIQNIYKKISIQNKMQTLENTMNMIKMYKY